MSLLSIERKKYSPKVIPLLKNLKELDFEKRGSALLDTAIGKAFPHLKNADVLHIKTHTKSQSTPLRVGVVLSGGQAAGGHTVICSLFDALKSLHSESRLYGFLDGPSGIIKGKYKELNEEFLSHYRNQGGFDAIGSGRTKIETQDDFESALKITQELHLDGLVVIGGDDSNTNAAMLAEYFLSKHHPCTVVGVPKTIDGDLQSNDVEISFGFDTACKVYSESIGNIAKDALSSKKYYFFVKLMGRSASHVTLECALQTQPNLALIGEEIASRGDTLLQVVDTIVQLIVERSVEGKDYGVILLPEGLIEFLHDVRLLIKELNDCLSATSTHAAKMQELSTAEGKITYLSKCLSSEAKVCFESMPLLIQEQLLLDRDPHGNVNVSKIETDQLLMQLVAAKLKALKTRGTYKGKFSAQGIFCGYEGRSALPSNFDCDYCYNLGRIAALLIQCKHSGSMAAIKNLAQPVSQWIPLAIPIVSLLHFEIRNGKQKAVIQKTLVDLTSDLFESFCKQRIDWRQKDLYSQPGPIQFFGPDALTDTITRTLKAKSP